MPQADRAPAAIVSDRRCERQGRARPSPCASSSGASAQPYSSRLRADYDSKLPRHSPLRVRTLRRGEILLQLLRVAPRPVARRVALDAPAVFQRANVNRVEAELVLQAGD